MPTKGYRTSAERQEALSKLPKLRGRYDRLTVEQLMAAREQAMAKVRAWQDAELLAGRQRLHTEAPAWAEYLVAFAALDERLELAFRDEAKREEQRQQAGGPPK